MSFLAAAHRTIDAKPEAVLEALRDFPRWSSWMPRGFRPVSGPDRALQVGDRFRVKIAGVPGVAVLRFAKFEPGRTLAWSGGVPGVLDAMHVFRVETSERGTVVYSEETWSGVLASVGLVARRVRAMAERVGEEQLEALAKAVG